MSDTVAPVPALKSGITLPSLLLLPLTLLAFYLLPQFLGKTAGYLISFLFYWGYCLVHGSLLKKESMGRLYSLPKLSGQNLLLALLCFLPAVGAFVASFLVAYPALDLTLYFILAVAALVNGFVEEFYWRGAFISRYGQNRIYALVLPTLLFGLWHISVYAAHGISYQGGFWPLVGGAFMMGTIWGYTAFRQQRVLIPTAAHILTNFFAFANLIVENGLY